MPAIKSESFNQAVDSRPFHIEAPQFRLRHLRGGRNLRTHRNVIMIVLELLVQYPYWGVLPLSFEGISNSDFAFSIFQ